MKRPTTKQYDTAAIHQALVYAPRIYECQKCGWPVVEGYCCSYCGNSNPSSKEEYDNNK